MKIFEQELGLTPVEKPEEKKHLTIYHEMIKLDVIIHLGGDVEITKEPNI